MTLFYPIMIFLCKNQYSYYNVYSFLQQSLISIVILIARRTYSKTYLYIYKSNIHNNSCYYLYDIGYILCIIITKLIIFKQSIFI